MNNFTVVSLFTGCGGLDFGFAKTGFNIIFANDFNRFACETYKFNFERTFSHNCSYLINGDINKYFDSIPLNTTILIGGAPCQSWSMMGNRKGADDKRGDLFFKTVDALSTTKPKYFLFENVKGLLNHEDGKSFNLLLDRINKAGYEYHYHLFNMSEYGVNQRRERVIIWGKRKGDSLNLTSLVPSKSAHGAKVLEDVSDIELRSRFLRIGITDPPSKIKGHRPIYRLNPFTVAPTMVFNNGTNIPWHPWEDRSLTVREAATIQGFPLTFEFMGKLQEQYKQVANAVPPIFSELLAKSFLTQLNKESL